MRNNKDKMVNGTAASYLMDATKHAANLAEAIDSLQATFCYREDISVGWTWRTRKHCRELIHALQMFDHVMEEKDEKSERISAA